ncbi:polysaccharide biosynthesis/export family protein [uncultured Kriegella sp.]|uniref:polysaccharide biosynthesis/export family protein n=1 Tax=uncultured Kriegella sp. TaxID=1798910 RepID=UPI0030DC2ACF
MYTTPKKTLVVVLLSSMLFSCMTNKSTVYINNPNLNHEVPISIMDTIVEYKLQPRDVLNVQIKTLDAASSAYFNLQSGNTFQQFSPAALYLGGYSITKEGRINLPEIGQVTVAGLTLPKAEAAIQKAVRRYLPNANVIVKMVSFKISVLGEVNAPGYYYVYNEQANLLEALALAGDMTLFGNRENITVLRQTESGMKGMLLDLRNPNIFSSEYFQLLPNDVVYVQPRKERNQRDNLNTFNLLSIVFGAISSVVLLLNFTN